MKRGYIILSLVLLFAIIFLIRIDTVRAADELPGAPISNTQIEQIENLPVNMQNKWTYLQAEWKNILTKNKAMNATDSFMKKPISQTTFRILFGINWDIAYLPTIIGVIILWIILFVATANLLKAMPIPAKNPEFAGFLCYIGALLIMLLFAQLNIFYNIITWLGRLIFRPENKWMRFVYFFIVLIIFIVIVMISDSIEKSSRANKKKEKEEELEHKVGKHEKFIQGVKEGRDMVGG
jgi:hypothetical protein